MMKVSKLRLVAAAYIGALVCLAVVGFMYANYKVDDAHHRSIMNRKFSTDVTYVDLPQMNVALTSNTGGGRIRINISLEVEKSDAIIVEDFAPKITDRIVSYMQTMDYDELAQPMATSRLRPRLMQITNSVTSHAPVIGLVFRQYLVL